MIVDAHLDIAFNALSEGRGFQGRPEPGFALSRDSLVAAGVGLVFPTIFVAPGGNPASHELTWTYRTPREASLMAEAQVTYYRSVGLPLLRTATELRAYRRGWRPGRLAGVLLMEGADPVATPEDLGRWLEMGVRIIGPAWSRTRYCGGTDAPGGFTPLGRGLLREMERAGVILDLSHLADRAVRQALDSYGAPVVATHVGARALNPGQRQLEDAVAKAVAQRGGVIGISFYSGHLRPTGKASVADVARHAAHFAEVTGSPGHVGLGSDLDGGFPAARSAVPNLARLDALERALRRHFTAREVTGIMGGNWLDLLERALPGVRGRR